jgi:hypothetical protein
MSTQPHVKFVIRYPAGDGKWRYETVWVSSPSGSAFIPMEHPPLMGDLITLWDSDRHRRGLPPHDGGPAFRVVDRMWSHSSWGSADWPFGESEPRSGPLLDIIVEPARGGAYRDETPICGAYDCEAVWVDGAWWMPPGADEPEPHEHKPYEPRESL